MDQPSMSTRWLFQDTVEGEHQRPALRKEQQKLAEDRSRLEREKREFRLKQQFEEERLAQQAYLFETKWKILERELIQLAKEKQELSQEKANYFHKEAKNCQSTKGSLVHSSLLFSGIADELSLKKRYKELIKIFHPDNINGDTHTLQEINREYATVRKAMGI